MQVRPVQKALSKRRMRKPVGIQVVPGACHGGGEADSVCLAPSGQGQRGYPELAFRDRGGRSVRHSEESCDQAGTEREKAGDCRCAQCGGFGHTGGGCGMSAHLRHQPWGHGGISHIRLGQAKKTAAVPAQSACSPPRQASRSAVPGQLAAGGVATVPDRNPIISRLHGKTAVLRQRPRPGGGDSPSCPPEEGDDQDDPGWPPPLQPRATPRTTPRPAQHVLVARRAAGVCVWDVSRGGGAGADDPWLTRTTAPGLDRGWCCAILPTTQGRGMEATWRAQR